MGIIRDNPVLGREWRHFLPRRVRRLTGWKRLATVGPLAAGLLYGSVRLFVGSLRSPDPEMLAILPVQIWAVSTTLVICAHTSRAIVQERNEGTWDALLITRLRPAEIVFGKLLAPLLPMWALGTLLLPTSVVAAARMTSSPHMAFSLAFLILSWLGGTVGGLAFGSAGLYASMRCSTVWAAQLWTFIPLATAWYGVALFGLFALPALLVRFNELERQKREG